MPDVESIDVFVVHPASFGRTDSDQDGNGFEDWQKTDKRSSGDVRVTHIVRAFVHHFDDRGLWRFIFEAHNNGIVPSAAEKKEG